MNSRPYEVAGRGVIEQDLAGAGPAPSFTGAGSTHELAQLIAMEMQRDIDARIDWGLQQRQPAHRGITGIELGLILGSIGIAVPLTAIAVSAAGLPGIVIVWLGLVLINVAWAVRR